MSQSYDQPESHRRSDAHHGTEPNDRAARAAYDGRSAVVTIGFVGLGVMGGTIAKRLLNARYQVQGYNRTAARPPPWPTSA